MGNNKTLFILGVVGLKLLLSPSYYSTDFEVHRNWLAITNTLPLKEWYYEQTSEWTLDYPPFFAYFEYFLSVFGGYFDPHMLNLRNLNYSSDETVFFQRTSVVLTELSTFLPLLLLIVRSNKNNNINININSSSLCRDILGLVYLSPGLLFVDNIHFQYNGFLYGILLYSILHSSYLIKAVTFSILLNFKHIYLYLAPAYFVHLLSTYCFKPKYKSNSSTTTTATATSSSVRRRGNNNNIEYEFSIVEFVKIGIVTIVPFIISLGPFIINNDLPQLITRLFPFKRGLCHAYWAPNLWSLYSFIDRVICKLFGFNGDSMTRGLVGDTSFCVLSDIKPIFTLIVTLFGMSFGVYKCWKFPGQMGFLHGLLGCGFASFLFSWHVHEKAILIVIIPFALLARRDQTYSNLFFLTCFFGYFSLFPLLFRITELVTKSTLFTSYMLWLYNDLDVKLDRVEFGYLSLSVVVFFMEVYMLKSDSFLPLMMYSVYNAIGLLYVYYRFSVIKRL